MLYIYIWRKEFIIIIIIIITIIIIIMSNLEWSIKFIVQSMNLIYNIDASIHLVLKSNYLSKY
jgi:hypothetical protein